MFLEQPPLPAESHELRAKQVLLYPYSYLPVSSLLEVPQDALSVLWVSRSLEQ